jgi:hypothetical protein
MNLPYSDLWPTIVQMRGQSFLSGVILSHHAVVGGGALQLDTRAPVLDACGCVGCLGTCIIDFYIEHMDFTRVCLPYARIITVHMHVSLAKLPLQIVMGRIPVLEYMLSGMHGLLQSCLILLGDECFRPPRLWCWLCLSGNESPRAPGSLPGRGKRADG